MANTKMSRPLSQAAQSSRNLHVRLGVICLGLLVLAIHSYIIHPWILDDAYITFRYAENLAGGIGPVFNVGESVEGYTGFLWMLLLATGALLGISTVLLAKVLGFVLAAATLSILSFSDRITRVFEFRVAVISTLITATCGVFTPWPSSGMEVSLFTFLILLTVLVYIRAGSTDDIRLYCAAGALAGLTALARPEGLLVVAVITIIELLRWIRRQEQKLLSFLLPMLVVFLPYFLWRWSYYGYLLPNTFYAKVGSRFDQVLRGLEYTLAFLQPAALLLLGFLAAVFPFRQTIIKGRLASLVLTALVFIGAVILLGGDCMPAFRFFAPIIPLLAIAAAIAICRVGRRHFQIGLLAAIVCGYSISQMFLDEQINKHLLTDTVALRGEKAGLWLRNNTPPEAVVATNTSGSVPYFSQRRAIDMLGLNDLTIAHREIANLGSGRAGHEKGDGAYVLSRRPDYIQFGGALGSRQPVYPSDIELYGNPSFRELYEYRVHVLQDGSKLGLYELIR
jgi:arabinofuranosyltransferase